MPRLPSVVLRRLGGGAVLLLLSALCLALPARHVLIPLWPNSVEEVLVETGSGSVERRFIDDNSASSERSPLIARSRPMTLWRLETEEGQVLHAWLAGVRDTDGQLMSTLPDWSRSKRLDGPPPGSVRLVLRTAARETREVDGETVRRMYRPNSMTLTDRTALWRDRLVERWRISPPSAVRMTPPDR